MVKLALAWLLVCMWLGKADAQSPRIGLALVLTLMVFATWNDLVHLGIGNLFKAL